MSLMEQYFKLAAMLVLWVIGCQGQHDLTAGQLHSRMRDLETTVEQLLLKLADFQTSQPASPTEEVPAVEKRGRSGYPINSGNGFTLARSIIGDDEVGFHVSLTDDVELGYGKKLIFDTIAENIGWAYHKGAAEFICPKSGTYLFTLSIACQKGSYVEVSVEISSVNPSRPRYRYVLNTVCDHRKRTLLDGSGMFCGNTQNGGAAIVSLSQGDKVAVKKTWPERGTSIIVGNGWSTFSGYLLRPS